MCVSRPCFVFNSILCQMQNQKPTIRIVFEPIWPHNLSASIIPASRTLFFTKLRMVLRGFRWFETLSSQGRQSLSNFRFPKVDSLGSKFWLALSHETGRHCPWEKKGDSSVGWARREKEMGRIPTFISMRKFMSSNRSSLWLWFRRGEEDFDAQ